MQKPARLAWRVLNAKAKSEADIDVYDIIGDPWGEGPNSADFVKELRALDVERINLHVNSPGGFVNDAIAMYNALLSHPAEIVAYVEGTADSAASFLIQAANKRVIAKNSSMTIHEGHAFAMGPASTMREVADLLDADSENIASIYAERAGGTTAEWRERMKAGSANRGTTYRGQAAVDIGLADEVGLATKNVVLERTAAQAKPDGPEPVDLGAAFAAARYTKPTPTIQQLLEQHQREPIVAATGR